MQNSFSLGLIHGVFYGLTPLTPWFIGLKRYVYNGQAKGLLTFAGIFLGQIGLLLLSFFGSTEVLWIWYYLEPLFILSGIICLLHVIYRCWRGTEVPTPLKNRQEGLIFFGNGILFSISNPSGFMIGDYLLVTIPENNLLYISGFVLFYTIISVGIVYLTFLSPLGQKIFGAWSIKRMLNFMEPSNTFLGMRLQTVQTASFAVLFTLCLQLFQVVPGSFTTYYVDTMFGATPAKSIMPKRDLHWVESTEAKSSEDAENNEDDNGTVKVWKLQSKPNMNRAFENERKVPLDEQHPFDRVYKYNSLNERLERNEITAERKDLELEYHEEKGLDHYFATHYNWVNILKRRLFTWKPAWDRPGDMTASWLQELTEIRSQMDDILRMQYATQSNEARPHLPFNIEYELDYDFDAEALAKADMGITEEVVNDLKALQNNPEVISNGFFNQTYDMVHRGGERMDFSIVKIQTVPKEVHFPWDYPVVHAPNVPEIPTGIQEADETAVDRRNDVQNNNVWFLDPIALNTRFLENDPLPLTDDRWVDSDTLELRAPNTTLRWWLGEDHASEENATSPFVFTPRETIMGKGGLRR